MPIPDFQTIMLPFLKLLGDNKKHNLNEVMDSLAQHFNLTPEELTILVPSGQMGLFKNRVSWTKTHLKNAGLIYYPERGVSQITEEGSTLLATNPKKIRMNDLANFPKYTEWKGTFNVQSEIKSSGEEKNIKEEEQTPQEKLGKAVDIIHNQLASDIIDLLKNNTFQYFEKFVVKLLYSMGYGGFRKEAAKVTGTTGDNGIDGVILQDILGLESVGIQAKRFTDASVGSSDIRNFIGSLAVKGFNKGVFLTTSRFSEDAVRTANESKQHKIILIDGNKLAQLAIEFNVGVQTEQTIQLKKIDSDFFDEI